MDLTHMAAMLSWVGRRGYQVREDQTIYGDERHDLDPDFDSNSDFDSDLDQDAKEPRSHL